MLRRSGRLFAVHLLAEAGVVACSPACGVGELPEDPPLRVFEAQAVERAEGLRDDSWEFEDGSRIRQLRVLRKGDGVVVRFEYEGDPQSARVGLLAPRDAGRQVVSQTPFLPAVDPRAHWKALKLVSGDQTVELELPAPWFPRTAHLVLELRGGRDEAPVIVRVGPRSVAWVSGRDRPVAVDGGRATLALLETPGEARRFVVAPTAVAPTIDGALEEPCWSGEGMSLVTSLEGEPVGEDERTRVWLAWDEDAIYVAARMRDRDVWGDFRERDDPIYREEAFEAFFGAGERVRSYLEFQVSPHGVVFDAAFTGHRKGGEAWNGRWKSAVQVEGSLDERKDRDEGWTVELAFPWSTLCGDTDIGCSPQPGAQLRMNLFRLDKDAKGRQRGQALTPTRKPDFHNWAEAAYLTLGAGE